MAHPTSRLFLIRHGIVDPAYRGRLYGDLDVELSDEGREQAREVAARLAPVRLSAVVSSGLARATFGAECVLSTNAASRPAEVQVEPRMRELSRGEWAGRQLAEVEREAPGEYAAWLADPGGRRPPGGESLADLAARVLPALAELAREHADGSVAVVAHGWVLRVAIAHALGLPFAATPKLRVPPATLHAIDWPLDRELRPILAGLDLDAPPGESRAWYRPPVASDR